MSIGLDFKCVIFYVLCILHVAYQYKEDNKPISRKRVKFIQRWLVSLNVICYNSLRQAFHFLKRAIFMASMSANIEVAVAQWIEWFALPNTSQYKYLALPMSGKTRMKSRSALLLHKNDQHDNRKSGQFYHF